MGIPDEMASLGHSSSQTPQAVELPAEFAGSSRQVPSISFGGLADEQMSIAASQAELESSGDEDLLRCLPLGCQHFPSLILS